MKNKKVEQLVIYGQLPNLNQYIDAERTNRYMAAALKKNTQDQIIIAIKQAGLTRFDNPVYMRYKWFEKNRRRDKDNVAFAKKFVQDALVACDILPNDGWVNIVGFSDEFEVDAVLPRVEVIIEEVADDV